MSLVSDPQRPQELSRRNWQRALGNMETDTLEELSSLLDRKLSTRDLSSRERRREHADERGAGEPWGHEGSAGAGERWVHGGGAGERRGHGGGAGERRERRGGSGDRDAVDARARPGSARVDSPPALARAAGAGPL